MKIFVSLSGAPQVMVGDQKIKFPTKKSEGIFYYLALNGRAMKSTLELMFWPELSEFNANKNLRNSIYYINKSFGCDLFEKNKGTLEFLSRVELELEVAPLQGKLLDGFYLKDCPDFDAFVNEYRNMQNLQLYDDCKRQFLHTVRTGQQQDILREYAALANMNPYDEDAALAVMEYFFSTHQMDDLVRVYKQLESVLREELLIEPLGQLQNLYKLALLQRKAKKSTRAACFYGRERELRQIALSHQNFAHGLDHENFFITGDVGSGKTYLLHHYLQHTPPAHVCPIRLICYEAEQDIQYKILSLLINKMLTAANISTSSLPVECQPIFCHFLPMVFHNFVTGTQSTPHSGQFTFFQVEQAFTTAFSFLIHSARFFIAIDDLQYCDRSSLDFIQTVLCRKFGKEVFLIACCRQFFSDSRIQPPVMAAQAWGTVLDLNNFSKNEVAHILSEQVQNAQPQLLDFVFQECGGNPLYLFEIINNLQSNSSVKSYQFFNLLEGKMRQLSRQEQTALHICCVFFGSIIPEAVAAIMGVELIRVFELMQPLIQAGFLKESLKEHTVRLNFVHEQFRKYTYEKLPMMTRKSFHTRIAEYLAHFSTLQGRLPELIDDIIYHYRNGGQTVKYLEYKLKKAAGVISINHDFPEFLTGLTQSYIDELAQEFEQTCVPVELKFEFMLFQASFAIKTCDYTTGVSLAAHILEFDTDHQRLLSAHKQLIYYGIQVRDYLLIRKHTLSALRLLNALPENRLEQADLLKSFALAQLNSQHYQSANKILLHCLQLLNGEPISEAVLYNKACIFNYLAYEYKYLGQYEPCIPLYEKAIQICTCANIHNGLPLFYMNLGQAYMKLGNVAAAQEQFLQFERLQEKIHSRLSATMVKAYLAQIYFDQHDYTLAAQYLSQAWSCSKLLQNPYEDAYFYQIICHLKRQCDASAHIPSIFHQLIPNSLDYYAAQAAHLFTQMGLDHEIPHLFA